MGAEACQTEKGALKKKPIGMYEESLTLGLEVVVAFVYFRYSLYAWSPV